MKSITLVFLVGLSAVCYCGAVNLGGAGPDNRDQFNRDICIKELASSPTATVGNGHVFVKTDQKFYYLDSSDTEYVVRIDGETGVSTTQRTLVRIEENGGDEILVYYVDISYVDGIVTNISAEGSYSIAVDL